MSLIKKETDLPEVDEKDDMRLEVVDGDVSDAVRTCLPILPLVEVTHAASIS